MLTRIDIINYYATSIKAKNYLEIGCAYNECFDKIKIPSKIGVDPYSGGTIRMHSNEFFKVNLQKFDIIFIDGEHEHEQVWRDFQSAMKFLRPRGYIFLHDMLPPGEDHAKWPFTDDDPKPRCGNSWRVIFDILKLNKEFYIIDRETGIGVWRNKPYVHNINIDSKEIAYKKFHFLKPELQIIDSTTALKKLI